MSIVTRVQEYLDKSDIHYQTVTHSPSYNALGTAVNSDISSSQVVKGVMLEDHEGRKLMAVLPASHKVNLATLNEKTHREFHLMKEVEVYKLFSDCSKGAVPPLAQAYNMGVIYDSLLLEQGELYLEAGDHSSLIAVDQEQFMQLMHEAKHYCFSHKVFH
ncbi:MAG: YbaK/EbsC family protein [Alteromonadales bacterium]|nr:YbaK/EbsC family protein [Alteromonadales bacterium]